MLRRIGRITFHLTALLSLIVCVAAFGWWLRCNYISDRWTWRSTRYDPARDHYVRQEWSLHCAGGRAFFYRSRTQYLPAYPNYRITWHDNGFKYDFSTPSPNPWVFQFPRVVNPRRQVWLNVPGFRAASTQTQFAQSRGWYFELMLPLWFVSAVAAILPVIWEIRYRRFILRCKRTRRGLCPACGYDLRATPERCPECGTPGPPKIRTSPGTIIR